ncbi:MAG: hypothetical protein R3202_13890 [Candidatus Competibacterales bacterium]|nr:hypothetical protein [Candidatus Competibacterales bacterium]
MNVQAADTTLQGTRCAIVVVSPDLVANSGEADMAIERLRPTFGGAPVVLMAQKDDGSPVYYGDQDLVEALRGVPLEDLPWQEYRVR